MDFLFYGSANVIEKIVHRSRAPQQMHIYFGKMCVCVRVEDTISDDTKIKGNIRSLIRAVVMK